MNGLLFQGIVFSDLYFVLGVLSTVAVIGVAFGMLRQSVKHHSDELATLNHSFTKHTENENVWQTNMLVRMSGLEGSVKRVEDYVRNGVKLRSEPERE